MVTEVKPKYTGAALQKKIQGSVWVEGVVTAKGDLTDIRLKRSLDREHGLDQAAMEAAKQWTFEPALRNGTPVAVRITVEMTFTLKG